MQRVRRELDQRGVPAALDEQPRVRHCFRLIGSDVNQVTILAQVREQLRENQVFPVLAIRCGIAILPVLLGLSYCPICLNTVPNISRSRSASVAESDQPRGKASARTCARGS